MKRAAAALVASLALAGLPARAAPQDPDGRVPVVNVPYVSQEERLCGGAAAAMLMRAAGARGIYAEDFAPLVDDAAGGIHTADLAGALRARGYGLTVTNGTADAVRQLLAGGRPVLVLIEDRPRRYHYVVVVGWTSGAVVFHDPARAPFLKRTPEQFDSSWRATGRWMLAIDVSPAGLPDAISPAPTAQTNTPAPSADRDAATRRFLERDYAEAAVLARRAAETNPDDRLAWRLLGASRYLGGDADGALDAWNHAADPRIDLVQIEGLNRTPHRAVERLIGVSPGSTLTRSMLVRGQRRLLLLPAGQVSRVSYTALPGNLAEVRGAIVERPRFPSRVEWTATAARVPLDRELSVSVANAGSAGDRLVAAWRFWEGRPRVGLEYAFPSGRTGGVWALSSSWQQEHYVNAAPGEVRDARLTWTNWSTARVRVTTGTGIARWSGLGTAALLDGAVEYRPLNDLMSFEASTASAAGSLRAFSVVGVSARWRSAPRRLKLFGVANVSRASSAAPLDRWPGAGAGRSRPLLLRAHPLLGAAGRIDGPVFGRTVAQGTLEAEREVARRGLLALGIATFADAARAWGHADGTASPVHVDVGLGARVRIAPGVPAIRLDVARGLRDGKVAFTAGWQMTWWAKGTR